MRIFPLVLALLAGVVVSGEPRISSPDPERFAKSIESFQEEDKSIEVSEGLILFTGSSSIRMWKSLSADFPEQNTLNRGFGGSHISDVLHYFDILIPPHKPSVIVLYCGENDLWSGKSSQQVVEDFKVFVKRVGKILPKTRIHYLACKPSPKRMQKWAIYQQCNRMIAKQCAKEERLNFIDVSKVMLDRKGHPLSGIWLKDQLHMNARGYESWTTLLRPILAKPKQGQRVRR